MAVVDHCDDSECLGYGAAFTFDCRGTSVFGLLTGVFMLSFQWGFILYKHEQFAYYTSVSGVCDGVSVSVRHMFMWVITLRFMCSMRGLYVRMYVCA